LTEADLKNETKPVATRANQRDRNGGAAGQRGKKKQSVVGSLNDVGGVGVGGVARIFLRGRRPYRVSPLRVRRDAYNI